MYEYIHTLILVWISVRLCVMCVCLRECVCVCVRVGECNIRTQIHSYVKTRSGKIDGMATLTNEA